MCVCAFTIAARIACLHISIVNFSFQNAVLKGAVFITYFERKALLVGLSLKRNRFAVKTVESEGNEKDGKGE